MPTQIGENRAKKMLKPTRCSDGIEHRFGRDHHRQRCCQVNLWRSEKADAGCALTLPPLHSAIRSPLQLERSAALIARRDGVEG
jgi:hypothetical protein